MKASSCLSPIIYASSQSPTMQAPVFADASEFSEPSSIYGNRCHSGVPTNATDASWGCSSSTTETRIAVVVASWSSYSAHSEKCVATRGSSVQSTDCKELLEGLYLVTILQDLLAYLNS